MVFTTEIALIVNRINSIFKLNRILKLIKFFIQLGIFRALFGDILILQRINQRQLSSFYGIPPINFLKEFKMSKHIIIALKY